MGWKRRVTSSALVLTGLYVAYSPVECPASDPSALDRLQATAPSVPLWLAPIWFLDGRAVHPHFLYVKDGDPTIHRVEIWQDERGPHGHLLVDRLSPLLSQRRGLCLAGERSGIEAEEVIAVLEDTPHSYAWRDTYAYFPGPNSNTFAAQVLARSGWQVDLPRQAIGKRSFLPFAGHWL